MVTHLLDTDICIYWLRGNPQVKQKLSDVTLGSLSICSIERLAIYSKVLKAIVVSLSPFGRLKVFMVSLSNHLRQAQDDGLWRFATKSKAR
jgi:predicted nucleic acid-binding protein